MVNVARTRGAHAEVVVIGEIDACGVVLTRRRGARARLLVAAACLIRRRLVNVVLPYSLPSGCAVAREAGARVDARAVVETRRSGTLEITVFRKIRVGSAHLVNLRLAQSALPAVLARAAVLVHAVDARCGTLDDFIVPRVMRALTD